ncbi:MAG: restriction endonuclease subunit S, partial [Candidatus Falkowbacteria bacterium]
MSSKQVFQVDPIDVKRLARGAHTKDLPEISLRENMLVITCSGTIGRVHIVPRYMDGWTANQHALRVIPTEEVNPGYLYAWLASDYGYRLLTRYSYGSVILEIDRWMLGAVPVPLPDIAVRNEIGDLVLRANNLRDEAWHLERKAISEIEEIVENVPVRPAKQCLGDSR